MECFYRAVNGTIVTITALFYACSFGFYDKPCSANNGIFIYASSCRFGRSRIQPYGCLFPYCLYLNRSYAFYFAPLGLARPNLESVVVRGVNVRMLFGPNRLFI